MEISHCEYDEPVTNKCHFLQFQIARVESKLRGGYTATAVTEVVNDVVQHNIYFYSFYLEEARDPLKIFSLNELKWITVPQKGVKPFYLTTFHTAVLYGSVLHFYGGYGLGGTHYSFDIGMVSQNSFL
jgi:hypothetical protein